jgi:transposase
MADWLLGCGVDVVALESTGVYWIPVYEVLEQRGLKVWLVDARQVKYVPGRKSDVQDCQWLQKLMSTGCCARRFVRRPTFASSVPWPVSARCC